jgi:hypothetical protein
MCVHHSEGVLMKMTQYAVVAWNLPATSARLRSPRRLFLDLAQAPKVIFLALPMLHQQAVQVKAQLGWHAAHEVLIRRFARGGSGNPSHLQRDLPDVGVNWKLRPACKTRIA